MSNHHRREFLVRSGAVTTAFVGLSTVPVSLVLADSIPEVDAADPQAVALGYVADATQTDTAKFKRYEAGQSCANCALYQGNADSETGPCPLFVGKSVRAAGWCNAWAPKP